eukprot:gnl/TRDRNA2_/TRDRNA2_28660_c0_seq1.p1 gnl/TRDRNA2_/TRDRNA2_28660_c0~~gnl/TRDRNA2_/TRDRNA2_28660_c0_seq1.p1  ORF type:complete len:198 (+),score=26.61 gnl/TRDRNA2_/TRDRNA2_28660_c0_seq1:78-671(+)
MGLQCCSVVERGSSSSAEAQTKGLHLLHSLRCGDEPALEEARALLADGSGVDLTVTDPTDGASLLHVAAGAGDAVCCQLLLERCPDLAKSVDASGCSPLHRLASSKPRVGGTEVCRLLIRARVDDALVNVAGMTAVDLARAGGDHEVFKLLEFRRVNDPSRNADQRSKYGGIKEVKDFLADYQKKKVADRAQQISRG